MGKPLKFFFSLHLLFLHVDSLNSALLKYIMASLAVFLLITLD
jgi:hypothetical protein